MLLAAAAASAEPAATDLEGLWVGHARYGPDARGTLMILRRGGGLVADIAGFTVPVQQQGRKLGFELPDGKGSFRGELVDSLIEGHWIQSVTVESGARYATPLVLRADGDQRWTGQVAPRDDHMTYYLPVTRGGDGRYATYLRNPERNQGVFLGVSRIEQDGDTVRLFGMRRGQNAESVIANGPVRPRGEPVQPSAVRAQLRLRTRDGKQQPLLRARQSAGAVSLRSAGTARRRMAGVDVGAGGHRPGDDRAFVQKLIDMPQEGISTSQVHSVLIARHGKLVLEEYFHGFDRDTPHDTRSAAKSWTNVLIGAAMQAGVPIRLDTPVYETMLGSVPADLDPRKKAMTLEHLISMTAGFDCDDSGERPGDEDPMQEQTAEPDWYRYSLNVPMAWNSGEQIVYCSMKPNLAAGMLEKVAAEPLPEMFRRLVAKPMHMRNYHLMLQPTGQPYGGGGHYFTTRDFMKLTQLFLNEGKWEGRQIVSREWAARSGAALRVLSPTSGQTYGYLWNSYQYPYRERKLHAYFPGGNGGQVYIGIPDLGLLIAFTGGNYADRVLFRAQREFVPEDILPAVSP